MNTFKKIFIIFMLAVTGGFLFVRNNNSLPSAEDPAASPTPTVLLPTGTVIPQNWKIYTSQKYHFEFSYPPEARLGDQSEGYVSVSFMGDKQKASGRTQTELFDGYAFTIADVTGSGYKNLDDFYAQKVTQLKDICTKIGDPRETIISERRAITHSLSCLGDYDAYYLSNGTVFFEIGLLHVGDAQDLPAYTDMVNRIFSTFRFTQ